MASTNVYEDFGRRLRFARQRRGLTQAELAEAVGMTRGSISNIEAGRQRFPLDLAVELARALGYDFVELLTEEVRVTVRSDPSLPRQFRGLDPEERGWAARVIQSAANSPQRS